MLLLFKLYRRMLKRSLPLENRRLTLTSEPGIAKRARAAAAIKGY